MLRMLSVVAILATAATVVMAQSDAITERQQAMKGIGGATGAASKMAKGETPFDLAKAKEYLQTYATNAAKLPTVFPESSKGGKDTAASPKIWETKADFDKRVADFNADIQKAVAGATDLESFRASLATITRNCGGCHETYRLKKS